MICDNVNVGILNTGYGIRQSYSIRFQAVFRIRIQFNPDPDQSKNLNPDPNNFQAGYTINKMPKFSSQPGTGIKLNGLKK